MSMNQLYVFLTKLLNGLKKCIITLLVEASMKIRMFVKNGHLSSMFD